MPRRIARQVQPRQVGDPRHAGKMRRQPVRRPSRPAPASDKSGQPASGSIPRISADPRLELPRGVGPGQRPQAVRRDRARQRLGHRGRVRRLGAVAQHQRAQPAPAARQHRAGDRVEAALDGFRHPRRQHRRQRIGVQHGGEADAGGRLHFQRRDHQQSGIGQRIGARQPCPAAARQAERARLAAPLGDAVGEGRGEQLACVAVVAGSGRRWVRVVSSVSGQRSLPPDLPSAGGDCCAS